MLTYQRVPPYAQTETCLKTESHNPYRRPQPQPRARRHVNNPAASARTEVDADVATLSGREATRFNTCTNAQPAPTLLKSPTPKREAAVNVGLWRDLVAPSLGLTKSMRYSAAKRRIPSATISAATPALPILASHVKSQDGARMQTQTVLYRGVQTKKAEKPKD